MNYIWEIVLRAKENHIDEKDLFFQQALEYSPYYEQSFLDIDKSYINQDGKIEVNGLYRFDKIFNKLLKPHLEETSEIDEYLFDIAMHFLVNVDLYSGISKQDIYLLKIKESIEQGQYGLSASDTFKHLSKTEQDIVLIYLLKQLKLGSSLSLVREFLKKIYPDMLLYQMKTEDNLILLYLGLKQSELEGKKLTFFLDLFLPLEIKIRVFWEHHFGVIDIDDTMILDNVELF